MYDLIYNTLHRQERALALLASLLDEEFDLMVKGETAEVMSLEMSIHELIRQLVREKNSIITMLGGGRLQDYIAMQLDEEKAELSALFQAIDDGEQYCSKKASQNAELSLALLDQSDKLLTFLHKQVQPPKDNTYGRKGHYAASQKPQAAIISGSL